MTDERTMEFDLSEKGREGQRSDRRLFVQFLAFGDCPDPAPLAEALEGARLPGAVYEDLHDPFGVGLVTLSEDPGFFLGPWRGLLQAEPFASLAPKPELTMFGRTYALGYEADLEETLVGRARNTALNPAWPWVVWYPLRRSGAFEQLPDDQRLAILEEHGRIGARYGRADHAHDIRLACHGLDTNDNDFVIAVTGPELAPLSKLVEQMRSTRQTSLYLERLGPFFVGRAAWKSALG